MWQWLIRTFGLKGSFAWAMRKMAKGEVVTCRSITTTLRYRLDTGEHRLVLSTFNSRLNHRDGEPNYNWQIASFNLSETQATDWCLMKHNKMLMSKLMGCVTCD